MTEVRETTDTASTQGGDPDTHITVNAVGNYIFGGLTLAFMVLGGLFLIVGAELFGEFMAQYYGPLGEFFRDGGALIGVMTILFGLVAGLPQLFAGIGLSRRLETGRLLALVVAAFHILYGLTLFGGNIFAIINLGFGGYAFWSLLQPAVVDRFRTGAPA